jgi:hypothetical protein
LIRVVEFFDKARLFRLLDHVSYSFAEEPASIFYDSRSSAATRREERREEKGG